MAPRDPKRDCEIVLKILSSMELSKPIALVTICQNTGIKLVDVIHYMEPLESSEIIERTMDNGLIFYILKTENYESAVEHIFMPAEEPASKPTPSISSREAILKRRSMRQANAANAAANADNHENTSPAPSQRHTQNPSAISTVELLAMKRSSTTNPRVFDTGLTTTRMAKLSAQQAAELNPLTRSSTMLQAITGSSPRKSISQSSTGMHKAVFVNRPYSRAISGSRSTFTATPPAGFDPMAFERSDANFPKRENIEPKPQGPLIPYRSTAQSSNEIPESEVREKLNLSDTDPLIAILSPRPTQELWSACSALANIGGGTIILGMRKYIQDGNVTYFIKNVNTPEDAIKLLIRGFNDRTLISDCPKDPNFIDIAEFGRKKVLVIRLDPEQLSDAPLYTGYNSYNMRTTQGCYIYRNGEVVHCTNDEIKELWQLRRLGKDIADWAQTGEQVPIQMERKKKINLPAIIDDAVRPLSRKVSTYGMPIQEDHRAHYHWRPSPALVEAPASESPTPDAPATNAAEMAAKREFHFPTVEEERRNAAQLEAFTADNAVAELMKEQEKQTSSGRRSHVTQKETHEEPSIQSLLFAEDIRVVNHPAQQDLPLETPDAEPDPEEAAMPPLRADADSALLEEIALPAVEHPRLPATRLCEIALELCKHARMAPSDFSDLLKRKYNVIRDKVLPKLKENPKIHAVNSTYYYQD